MKRCLETTLDKQQIELHKSGKITIVMPISKYKEVKVKKTNLKNLLKGTDLKATGTIASLSAIPARH